VDIDRYTLRRARVSAGLTLAELATRTRISPGLLKLIDDGEFDRLPGGLYARSYVRAVAKIVSVDPDEAVRALAPLMRDAAWDAKPGPENAAVTAASVPEAPTPLSQPFAPWQLRDDDWRRAAASIVDGAIVAGLWIMLWAVAAAAAGPGQLGAGSLAAVSVAVALLAAIYFLVFAGVGGSTPGDQVARLSRESVRGPVESSSIARRAAASFLVKASVVVDVMYTTEWALHALRMPNAE
jgi:hypothetical protein